MIAKDNRKKISFILDDILFDELQDLAQKECLTVSALIRRILVSTLQPERMSSK